MFERMACTIPPSTKMASFGFFMVWFGLTDRRHNERFVLYGQFNFYDFFVIQWVGWDLNPQPMP